MGLEDIFRKDNEGNYSAFRDNISKNLAAQQKQVESAEPLTPRKALSDIFRAGEQNPVRGMEMLGTFRRMQADPTSPVYNPYQQATSQTVLQKPVGPVNTKWLQQNEADEQRTRQAELEWKAMQEELSYKAKSNRQYSSREIVTSVDMNRYPTLKAMDESLKPGGQILPFNRGIGYNKDAMLGTIWAAQHDGGTGNDEINTAMSQIDGLAVTDPSVMERRDPSSPNYAPYSFGTTMEQEGMFFNQYEFSRDWVEQNRGMADSADGATRQMYARVAEAEPRTEQAEDELEKLNQKIADLMDKGYDAETIINKKLTGFMMSDEFGMLRQMQSSLETGEPLGMNRAIPFNLKQMQDEIRQMGAAKEAAPSYASSMANDLNETLGISGIGVNAGTDAIIKSEQKRTLEGIDAVADSLTPEERACYERMPAPLYSIPSAADLYEQVAASGDKLEALGESPAEEQTPTGKKDPRESLYGEKSATNRMFFKRENPVTRTKAGLSRGVVEIKQKIKDEKQKTWGQAWIDTNQEVANWDNNAATKAKLQSNNRKIESQLGEKLYAAQDVETTITFDVMLDSGIPMTLEAEWDGEKFEITDAYNRNEAIQNTPDQFMRYYGSESVNEQIAQATAEKTEQNRRIQDAKASGIEITDKDREQLAAWKSNNAQIMRCDEYEAAHMPAYEEQKKRRDEADTNYCLFVKGLSDHGEDVTDLAAGAKVMEFVGVFNDDVSYITPPHNWLDSYQEQIVRDGQLPPGALDEIKGQADRITSTIKNIDYVIDYCEKHGIQIPPRVRKNMDTQKRMLEYDMEAYEFFMYTQEPDFYELSKPKSKGKQGEIAAAHGIFGERNPEEESRRISEALNGGLYNDVSRFDYDPENPDLDRLNLGGAAATLDYSREHNIPIENKDEEEGAAYFFDRNMENVGGNMFGMSIGDHLMRGVVDEGEKKLFEYLYTKFGPEKAKQYYEFLSNQENGVLNARASENAQKNASELVRSGWGGAVLGNALAIGLAPVDALNGMKWFVDSIFSGNWNGKSATLAFNFANRETFGETSRLIEENIDNPVLRTITKGFYSVLYNRGRSAATHLVFGGPDFSNEFLNSVLGAIPMATGAAAEAGAEALNNGADVWQALSISSVTFFSEAVTEGIRLKHMEKALSLGRSPVTFKEFFREALPEMFSEAIGETLNDISENTVDELVMGDKSQHARLVDYYIMSGYAPTEAEARARGDELGQYAFTAVTSLLGPLLDLAPFALTKAATHRSLSRKTNRINEILGTDLSVEDLRRIYATREAAAKNNPLLQITDPKERDYYMTNQLLTQAEGQNAAGRGTAIITALATDMDNGAADSAAAAYTHFGEIFGEDADAVSRLRELMNGAKVSGTDANQVRTGIQTAALSENSESRAVMQSDAFQQAAPYAQAQMLAEAAAHDLANESVQQEVQDAVHENRVAEAMKSLMAEGAAQASVDAQAAVEAAQAKVDDATEQLGSVQAENDAKAEALTAATEEANADPENHAKADEVNRALNELDKSDKVLEEYEQHLEKTEQDLDAAKEDANQKKEENVKELRQRAEQMVAEEDAQRAEEARQRAAQREAEQENRNIARMSADEFLQRDEFKDLSEEDKQKVREVFEKVKSEMSPEAFARREQFIRKIGKKFNVDIAVLDTTNGGKVARQNGYYDNRSGRVVLDTLSTMDDAMYAILPHELVHIAEDSETYDELASALISMEYGEDTARMDADMRVLKELYDTRLSQMHEQDSTIDATPLSPEEVKKELVADLMGKVLKGDQTLIERLVAEKPSVARRILESIKSFFRKVAGLDGDWRTQSQKVVDMLSTALTNVQKASTEGQQAQGRDVQYSIADNNTGTIAENDAGEAIATELPGGTVVKDQQFSLSSWTEKEKNAVIKKLMKSGQFTREQVNKWITDVNSVASMIAEDADRLDFTPDMDQSFKKPNGDVYKWTLDASTLCAKRLLYQGTFNEIQKLLPNTPLRPGDLIELANMMHEMGFQTPCGICYVESRRRHLGNFTEEFLADYDGEYKPTYAELTSTEGLAKLKEEHRQAYDDYIAAMNGKGVASPKVVQLRTDYRGEVRSFRQSTIDYLNGIGGLRIQSFSDFETPHLMDMMQAIMDMAAVSLKSQAYTKVPNFAWVFGDTGIKINLSLMGDGTGVDENGRLVFSDTEGMKFDEAMKLRERYSKNVGTILVGMNDEHIIAAMGDNRIDFIIPFHRSGWSKEELDKMQTLANYTDYQDSQNERRIVGKDENGKYITESLDKDVGNFDPYGNEGGNEGYWDYNLNGEENSRKYLEMCKEDGRMPKFSQFLVDDGEGGFNLPSGDDARSKAIREGYWKTLIDFKMYDNDGVGAPQEAVTPDVNMDEAKRVLGEYVAPEGGNNALPVAQPVVERFVEEYKKTHPLEGKRTQYSLQADTSYMNALDSGDMKTVKNLVEEAAKKAFPKSFLIQDGEFHKMWHHTDKEFNSFLPGTSPSSGGIKGIYFTPQEHSTMSRLGDTHKAYYLNVDKDRMKFAFGVPSDKSFVEELKRRQEGVTDREELERINKEFSDEMGVDAFYDWQNGWVTVLDPTLIKSADPVTYDDQGQVIPLSERFNQESRDIRYSLPSDDRLEAQVRNYILNGEGTEQAAPAPQDAASGIAAGAEQQAAQAPETVQPEGMPADEAAQQDIAEGMQAQNGTPPAGPEQPGTEASDFVPTGPQRQWGSERAQESDFLHEKTQKHLYEHSEYTPDTNKAQIDRARQWVSGLATENDPTGYHAAVQEVLNPNFDYRSADSQAKMLYVMAMSSFMGNEGKADVKTQVAIADAYNRQGTDLGQQLQARKIFRLMTPVGRVAYFQSEQDKINQEYKLRGSSTRVQLSDETLREISEATTEEQFQQARTHAYAELAAQMPATFAEKLTGWRMLSMLGNPRTHIRNVLGNAMFVPAVAMKNKIGAAIEIGLQASGKLGEGERTKALKPFSSPEIRKFSREMAEEIQDVLTGEAKYKETGNSQIQQERKLWGQGKGPISKTVGKVLQKIYDFNGWALEAEDWKFLKGHFRRSFGGWMEANGYSVQDVTNNPELLEKGQEYAIKEAQKATYRDANFIADWLGSARQGKKNGLRGKAVAFAADAIFPFKKTPANVLQRGIEYSPVGLLKSLTYDAWQLHRYNKWVESGDENVRPRYTLSPSEWIDNVASGLTGTGVMLMGMFASRLGVATGALGNDPEDLLKKLKGQQQYSINFNLFGHDVSYTMDWAAPISMPFFVGTTLMEMIDDETGGGMDIGKIIGAVSTISEPVFNLSMLDGVNSLIKTTQGSDENAVTQIIAKTLSNYLTSFVPTALGQISRVIDTARRDTFVPSGTDPVSGTFIRAFEQAQNKTPFSVLNIPYRNVWGEEQRDPTWKRIFEIFSPGYLSEVKPDELGDEQLRLFESEDADMSAPFKTAAKSYKINGTNYQLDDKTFDRVRTTLGTTTKDLGLQVINDPYWQELDDLERSEIMKDINTYATYKAKQEIVPDFEPGQNKWVMSVGDNPLETIRQRSQDRLEAATISGNTTQIIKAVTSEKIDNEALTTSVQTLRDLGMDDKQIKSKLNTPFREHYKALLEEGDEGKILNFEANLLNSGLGFDAAQLNRWRKKAGITEKTTTTTRNWVEEPEEYQPMTPEI